MRKIFNITLAALALVTLSVACSKVDPVNDTPTEKVMTIAATLSDAATRVTFDPVYGSDFKPTAMRHTWQIGDKLRITDASDPTKTADFDLVDGAGTATGKFQGTGFEAASYNVEAIPVGTFNSGFSQTQAKDGSTDHLKYVAAATGVTDLTAITLAETTGIIGFIAKLPAGVAGTVSALLIDTKIMGYPITVTINLTQQVDTDADDVLKVYANAPAGFAIPADSEVFLRFKSTNPNHAVYTRYQKFTSTISPVAGKFNYIKMNCVHIDQFAGANDNGMEASPYLIADKYQMQAMHSLMPEGVTTHFRLISDIDLGNETWTPLNIGEGFKRGIGFDGNGHTISNLTVGSSQAYPSFFGVVNGTVKNVVFDGADITGGNNVAGVLAGYVGSASASIPGDILDITVKNSKVTGSKRGLGGVAGMVSKVSGTIENCHVIDTKVTSESDRVGGLFGQTEKGILVKDSSAENVTVSGTINIGGLVGVGYGDFTKCTSSGSISSTNTTTNLDIGLGGLVGYFENGTISKCNSSVTIDQTTNGRDIGGLIGKMLIAKVEKSYATGNVSGIQRNVGGLIGLITNNGSATSVVSDCYATGGVKANAYSGGLLGLFEKGSATVSNCYSTSEVEGSGFAMGGLIGVVGAASIEMKNSAAWNGSVKAGNIGNANWSSGAVVGVTFPTCTMTGNYRNPSMKLTAYWGTEVGYAVQLISDYSHADVSSTTPLTDYTGAQMTDVSTASGQPHHPIYPYQGHVDTGRTLSQLASAMLGWSSDVWDFSGELPKLK